MSQPAFPSIDDLLNPLTESNPVGPYLSYEDEYFELEEARRADEDASSLGGWSRQRKTSDWNKIISLGESLLREKSKDLQIAAWVTEAMAHVHGLAGMRHGLNLLRGLQSRFWEKAHPGEGDLELRQGVYEFLDGERILPLLVCSVPLTHVNGSPELSYSFLKYKESRETENLVRKPPAEGDLEEMLTGRLRGKQFDEATEATDRQFYVDLVTELHECQVVVERLNKDIKERWSGKTSAPQLTRVLAALRDVGKLAKRLLDRKPAPETAPETAEGEETKEGPGEEDQSVIEEPKLYAVSEEPLTSEEGTKEGPGEEDQSVIEEPKLRAVSEEPLTSIEQAREQIVRAAHYLRQSDPADPTSYLVLRALGIGELYRTTESLEASAFASPSSELRERLRGLEKGEDNDHWTKLLDESEQAIGRPEGRGWLDLQRYSLISMAALGHKNAKRACRSVLSACLRDRSEWPEVLLRDGTPCASEATKGWIRTEKIGGGPRDLAEGLKRLKESSSPPATSDNPPADETGPARKEADPWDQARSLSESGNAAEALAVMARAARQARTGRERFLLTLQQAELCLALERSGLALPLLDGLVQRVDEFRLEQWEDSSLCVRVFSNLYRCLRGQDEARARVIYNRLCQLDVSEALALGGP
jgi:type VI secretion system protein ImpA